MARMERFYAAAKEVALLDGEFWECGVYRGASAKVLVEILRSSPRPLRLFDTFQGFAGVSAIDGGHKDGLMSYSDIEDIRKFLDADFVTIYPGPVPTRFAGLEESKIAFANLDMDLYQPTRDALAFILPRMIKGGIIIIDDCGAEEFPGVELAVREIVGDHYSKIGSPHGDFAGITCWQGKIRT